MNDNSTPPSGKRTTRHLTRATDDAKLGGVCAGFARYLAVDPNLVRILAVIATLTGPGILVYIAAWLLVPADDEIRASTGLRDVPANAGLVR